jgi:drug/metabolite transporter (DMT)-like permease
LIKNFLPPHWTAASLKIFACLCYASTNGLVRYLTGGADLFEGTPLPFYEIAFLQNAFGAVLLLPFFIGKGKGVHEFAVKFPMLLFLQIIASVTGLLLWYAALKAMPIAYAVALAFSGPVLSVLACKFVLKEDLSPLKLMALFASIFGGILVTRPDLAFTQGTGLIADVGWAVLLPILSAAAWVGAKICSRIQAHGGESPKVITIYLLFFMAPISLVPALSVWVTPTLEQLLYTILLGVLGSLAYLSIVKAFTLANVSFLMPFGSIRLFFSGMIGYIVFSELPKGVHDWAGFAVILLSLVFLAIDVKRNKLSTV